MAEFTPEQIEAFKAYEASQAPKEYTEAEIEAFKDYEAKLADQANAIAGAEQSSPVVGGALGAAIPVATGATNKITKMVPTAKNVARHIDVPSGPQAVQGSGARNWNLAETGVAAPGTQMNKAGMDTNNRLASIVQPGGPFAGGEVTPGGIAISPQTAQELKEAKSKRPPMAKVKAGMAAAGEHPATQFGGKVAGGYGMGSNAMEAYNRLAKGEPSTRNKIAGYLNAAGSGAGAVGMAVPERFAKYRLPAVAASGALEWLANQVAEDNKKAAGGLIGHYAGGKQVQQLTELAKPVLKKFSEALGDVGAVGKNVATTQSDRTIVGKGQKGGPGFPGLQHTDPEHAAANAVWGVGKPEPATLMVNANKRDPNGGLIWTNYVGAPEQLSSNPMVIGELWDAFMAAAREGKLSPEQLKKMNARLSSDVKGNLFDKSVDITDPRFLDVANTFDKRRLAGDVIGGIGVGGPTKGRIVPYDDILSHYTDPAFIGQPTGVIGNRLFTLDNTVTHNPDIHAGFPYILGGKDLNVQFAPVPGEIGMRDFVAGKLKQKADKGVKPEMGTYDWIRGTPTQPITEEFLKYLQKEGFAKGGQVQHYAPGGAVKLFSALGKAIAEHKMDTMPGAQWASWLGANAPKSAKKEAEAIDFTNWLKSQPKASKTDIQNYINKSSHDINPVVKNSSETKFHDWQMPGGRNYKETLVQTKLPRQPLEIVDDPQFPGFKNLLDANGNILKTPSGVARTWASEAAAKQSPQYLGEGPARFQSNHWDEPDVAVHIRTNERPTADNRKALHLEEVQSDWGQTGRTEGFDGKGITEGPYVTDTKDWTGLGLKHALHQAADEGHDFLTLSRGDQQAERYNLSKVADRITHKMDPYSKEPRLDVYDINGKNIYNDSVPAEELHKHIGKDAAERLINAPANEEGVKFIQGDDLRFGGEGMKGYYDNILPNTLNDVLKQIGSSERVKPVQLRNTSATKNWHGDWSNGQPETGFITDSETGHILQDNIHKDQMDEAADYWHNTYGHHPGRDTNPLSIGPQMGIEITPELRQLILDQGFSKFKHGGSVPHMAGGKLVKSAVEAAPKIYQDVKDLILPPAANAARTQIIGTLPTYQKAGNMLKEMGGQGKTLDFGAGLGEGAKVLDADTFEPFAKNWSPTFTNASDIPSDAYGQLTNLNVLNVMPREMRDQAVSDIGRVMDRGGLGVLTTRGKDVMKAQGRPGPEPTSIITSRDTYQKGFSPQELEEYLKYILGSKFDVNKVNLGPAGAVIRKK